MATPTPGAPVPPQRDSGLPGIVFVLLGVLVVSVAIIFAGIYVGARYFARHVNVQVREGGQGKSVEIRTPGGELKIHEGEEATAQRIGLPIYPGAAPQKKGASVSIDVGSEGGTSVLVQKYETPDPLDRVADFYRKELGPEFSMERGKHGRQGPFAAILKGNQGGIIFKSESGERHRFVAISRQANVTEIALAIVAEKKPQ